MTLALENINSYYLDEQKKLKTVVNKILSDFGGIYQKDLDDFYSIAGGVLADIASRWDGKRDFDGFAYSAIRNKIHTEITRRNRIKRTLDRMCISLDTPVPESNATIGDLIESDFNIENKIGLKESQCGEEEYIKGLSLVERKILNMLQDGYLIADIEEDLNLTHKEFNNITNSMKSYEKRRPLMRDNTKNKICKVECKEGCRMMRGGTAEKSKTENYSVATIVGQLKNRTLRDDFLWQRDSGQWSLQNKSMLIVDILLGKSLLPIIVSEEIVNDMVSVKWLIDGKQRCTILEGYVNDSFRISRAIPNGVIQYSTYEKDNSGKLVMDEHGYPIPAYREMDVCGKFFSQLPSELQEKLMQYQIPVTMNLGCTKEEIIYDISRFNRCKPMNKSQTGIAGLCEDYLMFTDKILKLDFFNEFNKTSNYTSGQHRSGNMRRLIVESIMLINYMDDMSSNFEKNCRFLSDTGNDIVFNNFYELIKRLSKSATEEVASIFNQKDSFLWFKLFSEFITYNMEDSLFVKFLIKFKNTLHSKEVNGVAFDDIAKNGTKHINKIHQKIEILETLMYEFLNGTEDKNVEGVNDAEDAQVDTEDVQTDDAENINIDDAEDTYFDDAEDDENINGAEYHIKDNDIAGLVGNDEDCVSDNEDCINDNEDCINDNEDCFEADHKDYFGEDNNVVTMLNTA